MLAEHVARQTFTTVILSIFAGIALILAAIGIYGLMSYSVEQRTQEIGIRLALGAAAGQVKNMVVLQGLRLALAGVAGILRSQARQSDVLARIGREEVALLRPD